MVSKEEYSDEEQSWVDPGHETSCRKVTGQIKIPRLLVDPQLENIKFEDVPEPSSLAFSKNLAQEVQKVFDKEESHRKLLKNFTLNFDKKMAQDSEIESLKVQVEQLRQKLERYHQIEPSSIQK